MMTEERRSVKERRQMVRRDADACALCEHYREQEKERNEDNDKEHEAMWKRLDAQSACAAHAKETMLPRWVFISFMGVAITILGAGFGYFGSEIKSIANTHTAQMEKISDKLNTVINTQFIMKGEIENLKKAPMNVE